MFQKGHPSYRLIRLLHAGYLDLQASKKAKVWEDLLDERLVQDVHAMGLFVKKQQTAHAIATVATVYSNRLLQMTTLETKPQKTHRCLG